MATTNGSWVVASSKKSKAVSVSPSTKGKKKPFVEGMPRIEPSLPVQESPTIYSMFMQEEEKKERKLLEKEHHAAVKSASSTSSGAVSTKKGSQMPRKAAVADKKKEKPIGVEEALHEISLTELQEVLAKDKSTFPDNPDVWLKDLVSLLNLRLDKLTVTDPTFADKPADFPACLLSKPIKAFLLDTLAKMTPQTLHVFLDHCIESMMNDIVKGIPTFGFHIYIQLLLSFRPQIGVASLPTYLAQLKDSVNRPQRALCILWSLGQCGLSDLSNGLKVWLELMLPFLNIRSLSSFAVQYLETLFRRHQKSVVSANAAFPKRELFKLFDELFSNQPTLAVELRNRLLQLYPQLKVVAFGSRPDTTLHNFFSSFLSRCTVDCHGSKKTELLSCMVTCLLTDKQSFSIWRQIYVKNLAQSSVLMRYLADNLDGSMSQVDRHLLRETVRAFHVTNDDLASNPTSAAIRSTDLNLCVDSCQDLLNRLHRFNFPSQWFTLIVLVIFSVLIAFGIDVYTSGSTSDSHTYRLLNGLGVIQFLMQAWQRLCHYSTKVWLWLVQTVPVYWAKVVAIIFPYFTLVSQRLLHLLYSLCDAVQPVFQWLYEYMRHFALWAGSKLPWLLEMLSVYAKFVFNTISWLCECCVYYINLVVNWTVSNILIDSWSPENILKTLSSVLMTIKSYILNIYQWSISHFA